MKSTSDEKIVQLNGKIDVESLNLKEIDELSMSLGRELSAILKEATEKSNLVVEKYGMKVKINYKLVKIGE